jgi:predicted MPP superfamily phosphohydrolase
MSILIIGDVHGRTFWKDAVERHAEGRDKIVFLGDYLDPYNWEGITRRGAINNFADIIEYKKAHTDKVILLLGNHDYQYYDSNFRTRSRYDSSHAWSINRLFNNNRGLFQLAYEYEGDKHYLFTHAGVLKSWYEQHKELIGDLNAENLNKLKGLRQGTEILMQVSRERGGFGRIGSIVWSDIAEKGDSEDIDGIYQIFGHSQQEERPVITKTWACLDCRKAFILTEDGGFQDV